MPQYRWTRHCLSALFIGLALVCLPAKSGQAAEQNEPFTEWLEDFQAWDVLQEELSRQSATPKTVLKRAELLLRLNKPAEARELLTKFGSFGDTQAEAERLWLMARSYRMQQKPVQALLQFSRAAQAMDDKTRLEFMRSEPGLDWYWKAVWKRWYWSRFTGTQLLANQGQQSLILQAAVQAEAAWPKDPFWSYAADRMRASLERSGQNKDQAGTQGSRLGIDARTARSLATSMASAAIGDMDAAAEALEGLQPARLRQVWSEMLGQLFEGLSGAAFESRDLKQEAQPAKYLAFREWALPTMQRLPEAAWRVQAPESAAWSDFRARLRSMPPDQALRTVRKELESTLLGKELKSVLAQYALTYALLADRSDKARQAWSLLQTEEIPLSLQICGLLLGFQIEASSLFEADEESGKQVAAFVIEMIGPGDFWASHLISSFWIKPADDKELEDLHRQYPLDRLLSYCLDRRAWDREHSQELAKRAALLYPSSRLRNTGLFFLAQQAHDQGKVRQAWDYVQIMNPDMLGPDSTAEYLLAKAGLLMEMGKESKSLRVYKQILELDPEKLPRDKKLKLALMAQRHGQWEWAQSMLKELWAQRESLSSSLQAEVMFWLAEGAQKRGNQQKALENYLKLAWEYPQEHIWAVTALYRSALIYEQQGRLNAAKRLLEQVLDRADRDSQKKAAEDRIEAIERKMDQGVSAPELDYLL